MQPNALLINLVALAASASCLVTGQEKRDADIVARRFPPEDGISPELACHMNCHDKLQNDCLPLCNGFCKEVECNNGCNDQCRNQYGACLRGCP
ncbi:hypothetical protein E4U54_003155 [Claviceps lovelessii]|nr:hypothetical protein E4U54_003155 [Claviceps lovelessii]